MSKKFFFISFVLLSSVLFIRCEKNNSLLEPSQEKTSGQNTHLKKEANAPFFQYRSKNTPTNYSVQSSIINACWESGQAVAYDFYNHQYDLIGYRIECDGSIVDIVGSDQTSYSFQISPDGQNHSWQIFSLYQCLETNQTSEYSYNDYSNWYFRAGLSSPSLSGSWSNNHPSLAWNSIPGATGYVVMPSDGSFPAIVSSTNFIDNNYTGPGTSRNISYYVYAFNGTWPISCVISENSNSVDFSVN